MFFVFLCLNCSLNSNNEESDASNKLLSPNKDENVGLMLKNKMHHKELEKCVLGENTFRIDYMHRNITYENIEKNA